MKAIVRKIDRALKRIYNLENRYWAERFLLRGHNHAIAKHHANLQGAIFVQGGSLEQLTGTASDDLSVAIYFSEPVRKELSDHTKWRTTEWSQQQMSAFAVATEEISHFNYLIHNAMTGRAISQLELELQGEVDKFLLSYFALITKAERPPGAVFEALFNQLFERFHWSENLNEEQMERYAQANQCAQRFILKCRADLAKPHSSDRVFKLLRQFYRLSASDKMSFVRR